MIIPAELFHRAGVALYGEQYVAPMAALLAVPKNTVGKFASGKSRIPPGIWRTLLTEAERREKTLGLLREALLTVVPAPDAAR